MLLSCCPMLWCCGAPTTTLAVASPQVAPLATFWPYLLTDIAQTFPDSFNLMQTTQRPVCSEIIELVRAAPTVCRRVPHAACDWFLLSHKENRSRSRLMRLRNPIAPPAVYVSQPEDGGLASVMAVPVFSSMVDASNSSVLTGFAASIFTWVSVRLGASAPPVLAQRS